MCVRGPINETAQLFLLARQQMRAAISNRMLIAAALVSVGLAGCSPSTELLNSQSQPSTQRLTSAADSLTMVEVRPIVGPPVDVQQRLTRQLNQLAQSNSIALFIPPSYQQLPSLQISLTAVQEEDRLHVGFVSEVSDVAGQQVERLTGEEVSVIPRIAPAANFGKTVTVTVTVKKGDTLSSLATSHEMTVVELKRLNNLKNTTIQIGQKLVVQSGAPPQRSPWESVTDWQINAIAAKIMKSLTIASRRLKVAAR